MNAERFLFNNNPMAMLITDKNGDIKSCNPAAFSLFQVKDILEFADNTGSIFPERMLSKIIDSFEQFSKHHNCYETEISVFSMTGQSLQIYVYLLKNPEFPDDYIFMMHNITKYKNLIEENELLARLPQANPDMVIMMDDKEKILYLNPKSQKELEKMRISNPEKICSIYDILPENFSEFFNKSISKKEEVSINYERYRSNYLMKIRHFDDQICMITISDLTDFLSLKKEKELLAEAFENNNQPMIITDKDSKIIKVNSALEELYGYTEQELKGQKINRLNPGRETYRDLGYSDQEYDELFDTMWNDLLNPAIGKWDGTVINRSKKGRLIWARLLISAVYNQNQEVDHFIGMPVDISKTMDEAASTKVGLYQAIADLAEMRDNETGNHMKRIGLYSRMMAEELGMPKKYCEDIEIFAPLHDIGKVGISDSILLAERKLSEDEFEIMKHHSMFGYQILKDKEEMSMAADITLNHHEKYNGSGYPGGKKAEEIPLSARITAISDVYDALRSKRPYKEPWTHEEAVKEMIASSGSHFDPRLITVFIKLEEKFDAICENLKD